jgi:hypothetical protein
MNIESGVGRSNGGVAGRRTAAAQQVNRLSQDDADLTTNEEKKTKRIGVGQVDTK